MVGVPSSFAEEDKTGRAWITKPFNNWKKAIEKRRARVMGIFSLVRLTPAIVSQAGYAYVVPDLGKLIC